MLFLPLPFTPKHPILHKYVRFYYFLKTEDADFETKYYAFPHTDTVLNIHQRANFEIRDHYTRVYEDKNIKYNSCVQGIREYPLLAHLQGKLDKITVLFKPMGINNFGVNHFGDQYTSPSSVFTSWNNYSSYKEFLNEFYATTDTDKRIEIFEAFLIEIYQPIEIDNLLVKAIDLLTSFNDNYSIEAISDRLEINVRTLNRSFKKNIGVTPVTYRKVARFRYSMQNKLVETNVKRLTDIAYQSNYYDQAYFNKIFRGLTGSNPQRFFNQVDRLADNRLIFEFMK
jgi:AraC-like DNA-binding protein